MPMLSLPNQNTIAQQLSQKPELQNALQYGVLAQKDIPQKLGSALQNRNIDHPLNTRVEVSKVMSMAGLSGDLKVDLDKIDLFTDALTTIGKLDKTDMK